MGHHGEEAILSGDSAEVRIHGDVGGAVSGDDEVAGEPDGDQEEMAELDGWNE